MEHDQTQNGKRWPYLLLLVQFVAMLWVPYYNVVEPTVWGIPFFYWYQMLWVAIGAVLTGIVYLVTTQPSKLSSSAESRVQA